MHRTVIIFMVLEVGGRGAARTVTIFMSLEVDRKVATGVRINGNT